ncbi:hypothetical protein DCO58_07255 [Helicobacter saguini]|uniref:Uncharacterized protein n=1 Tax=Helicobacter saguini TaxID=1548018 RepID=A0A347VN79_9HELI|nr:hypothetical protein [Helicobacter saguini]MWV61870.1 hypothetical protein [Helicobacter saguini]MWV67455.1 hypothetical protein [Helicobacter saguini]MWV69807.1 hypothetical protein [Helicobacter saguini]MWV72975.1 hypothetical protein [Helicobacter saguini]TLD95644.1 hypothetical protein LS64_001975 [Helicobacter saguini]
MKIVLVNSLFKRSLILILVACSLFNIVFAKVGAKDASKSFIQGFLESTHTQDVRYNCDGDDRKATCSIPSIDINGLKFKDVKVTSVIDSKNANFVFSANIASFPTNDVDLKDFAIKKVNCKTDSKLQGTSISSKTNCVVNADAYTLKVDLLADIISNTFLNKEIGDILDSNKDKNATSNYKILAKESAIHLYGPKLGDKIYTYMKKTTPELTKEQFNTQVNVAVTSLPMMLAQNGNATPDTLANISSLSIALGSVITGKKQGVSLTLRRKNTTPVEFDTFIKNLGDLNGLTQILKDYDVIVSTR